MTTFELTRQGPRQFMAKDRPPELIECPICAKPAREKAPPISVSSYESRAGMVRLMESVYRCQWRHEVKIRWSVFPRGDA